MSVFIHLWVFLIDFDGFVRFFRDCLVNIFVYNKGYD